MKQLIPYLIISTNLLAVNPLILINLPIETQSYSYHRYTHQQIKNYRATYNETYSYNRRWQNLRQKNTQKVSPEIQKALQQFKTKIAYPEQRQAISDFIKGKKPFLILISR